MRDEDEDGITTESNPDGVQVFANGVEITTHCDFESRTKLVTLPSNIPRDTAVTTTKGYRVREQDIYHRTTARSTTATRRQKVRATAPQATPLIGLLTYAIWSVLYGERQLPYHLHR